MNYRVDARSPRCRTPRSRRRFGRPARSRRRAGRTADVLSKVKQPQTTALYDRTKLPPGAEIDGPAILLQSDATTVIDTGRRARVVELGQIEILRRAARWTRVTFQVIQSRLSGIVQEMQDSIFRTGYSTIIRESQDASCMLLDADGNVVGEHVILPLHVSAPAGSRARGAPRVRRHRAGRRVHHEPPLPRRASRTRWTWRWSRRCSTPATLVAFCGSIAHKSDLGGVVPGTANGSAREIFQEGIQYPPIRFVAAGEPSARHRGDPARQQPHARTRDRRHPRAGRRRRAWASGAWPRSIARYGIETVLRDVRDRCKTSTEAAHPRGAGDVARRRARSGSRSSTPTASRRTAGALSRAHREARRPHPLRLHAAPTIRRDGPMNIRPSLARGCCYYALIAMIDPTLPNNGGVARVVETTFRAGSVLDPRFPAPMQHLHGDAHGGRRSDARRAQRVRAGTPHRRQRRRRAASRSPGGVPSGEPFVQYELIGSAYGGRAPSDGVVRHRACCSPTRAPRRSRSSRASFRRACGASN